MNVIILFELILLFQWLDIITTKWGLKQGAIEINPIVGNHLFLISIIKIICPFLLLKFSYIIFWMIYFMLCFFIIMIYVVIDNYRICIKEKNGR
jgi:hypothetical protein